MVNSRCCSSSVNSSWGKLIGEKVSMPPIDKMIAAPGITANLRINQISANINTTSAININGNAITNTDATGMTFGEIYPPYAPSSVMIAANALTAIPVAIWILRLVIFSRKFILFFCLLQIADVFRHWSMMYSPIF